MPNRLALHFSFLDLAILRLGEGRHRKQTLLFVLQGPNPTQMKRVGGAVKEASGHGVGGGAGRGQGLRGDQVWGSQGVLSQFPF